MLTMRNSLWGIAFQVIAVAIMSGIFTYHYIDVYRGHFLMALGVFGIPIAMSVIFNAGVKRMIAMCAILSVISFFVCGYISVFLMGYY
jgi:hypothetical protein